ncbi:lysylphosphatidylglycerol synthase transmembrane domain-containing protein [Sodalinema gerasimenkoae]|uniref:lysylphosphatidylglycerol synthase transmembrane domain-containing protein n=1 Tax=Sodalinema gerasimenkoae TaxID=2862348 RepID=UPI00135A4535|nr:lysylphosphatidylglycerol synthase domain-containing protein [Sodalinema gerasimenkoae]
MKSLLRRLKPYLRWFILGATLFFLLQTLYQHWSEVSQIRLRPQGGGWLVASLGLTLLAHTWSGWVWGWILREFNQPVSQSWATRVFLKTNIAKYLPGNIWHFYGRIREGQKAELSGVAVTASVLLEPLLMAAATLPVVLFAVGESRGWLGGLALVAVCVGIHPRFLNPILEWVAQLKLKGKSLPNGDSTSDESPPSKEFRIRRYPLRPLMGEFLFVGLRTSGFLLVWLAIAPISLLDLPLLFGGFSFAWLLGLVVPGAPGGVGVLEATAVSVLGTRFPMGTVLAAVTVYRLMSVIAEAAGAAIALLWENRSGRS